MATFFVTGCELGRGKLQIICFVQFCIHEVLAPVAPKFAPSSGREHVCCKPEGGGKLEALPVRLLTFRLRWIRPQAASS
jgi:hypothetical protein